MKNVEIEKEDKTHKTTEKVKLYKIRWFMLLLYFLNCVISLMQWIEYSIISDVIVKYYNVSYKVSNWTSMIYLFLYVVFLLPGNFILEKFGLGAAINLGAVGTCLGAWIKVFSVEPDKFWVLMLGQSIVAASQVFFLGTSAHVAAEWFGCNEVSFACSVGAAGIQVGVAIGFVVTPIVVKSNNNLSNIKADLLLLSVGVAMICSLITFLTLLAFRNKPLLPPSQAQLLKKVGYASTSIFTTLKELLVNRNFVILAIVYGIDIGISYSMAMLLNEIILTYYPNAFEDAGRIGLIIILTGIITSILFGIILDKFKLYKITILVVQLGCIGTIIFFSLSLTCNIITVYFSAGLLGMCIYGVLPVGFEVAAEITYPVPEGISSGLLNIFAQILGILTTYLYSILFYHIGVVWASAITAIIFLIGFIMLIAIPFELKRQKANSTWVRSLQVRLLCANVEEILSYRMESNIQALTNNNNKEIVVKVTKVYKRRWLMLFLYFVSTIICSMQWSQYSSIANVISNYYDVSYNAVNWTSMIFLLIYIPLMFPVSYILEILGLRYGILSALFLTCASCWLKVIAVSPEKFWLVLFSQSIGAAAMPLVLSALTLLSAEWFDLNQISTASSIGVFAYQIGCGTGFIVPTFAVSQISERNTFEHNFYIMLLSIAVFSTVYLAIFFLFFENKPPLPPSEAKLKSKEGTQNLADFWVLILTLIKNRSYVMVLLVCGISNGISTSIDTLLNQIMVPYYKDAAVEAGRIAFVTYGSAAIGPIVSGLILDKFNRYRFTFITTFLLFLLLLLVFTFTFNQGILCLYITLSTLGFFAAAIELLSLETAIEITFPIPESISSGIIFGVFQAFSVGFIYCYSWIFYNFGEFSSNLSLCIFGLIAFIMTLTIKFQCHRQNTRSVVV
ncbi:hypothetical protein RN001_007516 [Aquatica leii]|uniref:Major facilitator superfamily (MFS) profile domain-containing protein n=1 Tax=Aquatica leii TaxID=1421715 RepID=A0AAN7P2Z7_9COLE|nr:hypothetical protein RN001_007516 [Aquatica leii]